MIDESKFNEDRLLTLGHIGLTERLEHLGVQLGGLIARDDHDIFDPNINHPIYLPCDLSEYQQYYDLMKKKLS